LNVFISWSGENTASHRIALALRDWLPCVINSLAPFVSTEDIQKGERGLARIEEQLKDSGFGIICVTKENYKAPWLLFEAGALSSNPGRVPVVPFLFGLEPSDLTGSPLLQFQAAVYSGKESIKALIQSLNDKCADRRVPDSVLNRSFEMCYSSFETLLLSIDSKIEIIESEPSEGGDKTQAILEEILNITRTTQRALSGKGITLSEFSRKSFAHSYEFEVEFEVDNGRTRTVRIGIHHETLLSDVLDEIYFRLDDKVEAFTYLVHWILQEKDSGRQLVVSDVKHYILAHTLFREDSVWEIKFLDTPYVPTIDANRRWYRK